MGIFNFFKRPKPEPPKLHPFETNISDFSEAEITEWMQRVKSDPDLLPPAKSDEYISRLINQLIEENGIKQLGDKTENGVRSVTLSIERGEGPDLVGIQYALYQPNVAYITTAKYPIIGKASVFNYYCSHLMDMFPILQIGANTSNLELPGNESIEQAAFAIRIIVPLVGADDDYQHLLTATKCLPIYGYDTKDGFYQGELQPHPGKSGINIQLEKIVGIFSSKSLNAVIPSGELLYGHSESLRSEIKEPASSKLEVLKRKVHSMDDAISDDNSVNIMFLLPHKLPSLWQVVTMKCYTVNSEEDIDNLYSKIGAFCYPNLQESEVPGILFKQSWIVSQEGNKAKVLYGMVGCFPNEFDIKVMSWQIARFQSLIPE